MEYVCAGSCCVCSLLCGVDTGLKPIHELLDVIQTQVKEVHGSMKQDHQRVMSAMSNITDRLGSMTQQADDHHQSAAGKSCCLSIPVFH